MKSVSDLLGMSYPDFVGRAGLINVPPGGRSTIDWWLDNCRIDANSRILDLACSTGFSGREIARSYGCSLTGIDRSRYAIESAQHLAASSSLKDASYLVGDAARLPFSDNSFTHVVAGSSFGFFPEPHDALGEVKRVLVQGGRLLVVLVYYEPFLGAELSRRLQAALGVRVTRRSSCKSFWTAFFSSKLNSVKCSSEFRQGYMDTQTVWNMSVKAVYNSYPLHPLSEEQISSSIFHLFKIRLLLNEIRPLQRCVAVIYEKR